MGRIPDEIIQQLRDRVDIVDLVGRYVTLKRAGRNYKGLCPFHDEKTPSFNVNPDRQSFHCFGCEEGGSAISFLMRQENLEFPEAVRALAAEHGIEVPEVAGAERGLSEQLLAANDVAQETYRAALDAPGNIGSAYLAERGLDPETIDHFEIGLAPDSWDTVLRALRQRRIPAEIGQRAGLLAERRSGGHYDLLRGRVTFPIRDVRGRIIAFGGRSIEADREPKYLNSPESPIFHKRSAFYGFPGALAPIRSAERAVVVEGYFDLIALHRAEVEGVLATCGTALGADHARNLRRRTRQVVLLFDGDEAGQRAMERALEVLLPEGLRVRAAVLPAGEDPDSFLADRGATVLRALVNEASPALDVAIRRACAKGCASPWEKADAVAAVAPLLALIPLGVERREFGVRLALAAGTRPEHVEEAVRAARRGEDTRDAVPIAPRLEDPSDRRIRQLARSLVEHPHLGLRVGRDRFLQLVPRLPLGELIDALVTAAAEPRGVDLEGLCEQLGAESAALLRALAAEDQAPEEGEAARTIDDTLRWLEAQTRKSEQQALTEKMREPGADPLALLLEKQRLSESESSAHRPAGPPT